MHLKITDIFYGQHNNTEQSVICFLQESGLLQNKFSFFIYFVS